MPVFVIKGDAGENAMSLHVEVNTLRWHFECWTWDAKNEISGGSGNLHRLETIPGNVLHAA